MPVYVVEPDRVERIALSRELNQLGIVARPYSTVDEFVDSSIEEEPGCIIIDLALARTHSALISGEVEVVKAGWPLIISMAGAGVDAVIEAVRLGAIDFVRKPFQTGELKSVLGRGATMLHQNRPRIAANEARRLVGQLTERERQVAACLLEGLSSKEIGRRLGLSPRTIEMHRGRLSHRLGTSHYVHLIALLWFAFRA